MSNKFVSKLFLCKEIGDGEEWFVLLHGSAFLVNGGMAAMGWVGPLMSIM